MSPADVMTPSAVKGVVLHGGDLTDFAQMGALVSAVEPDVIFNLGGISSVAESWNEPVKTGLVTGMGTVNLLASAWDLQEKSGKTVRFVQASSSEIFGSPRESPQTENTPISAVNPYGAAKAYAHQMTAVYRARGLFASSAILFNHESPRRPISFVTRKITQGVARIACGLEEKLVLGNLDARRDWGWAPDYVRALVSMSEAPAAGDFVVASGVTHSVRDFVDNAFRTVGILDWEGYVEIDPRFMRPSDPTETCGDPTQAERVLGWKRTVEFEEIVARMTTHDYNTCSGSVDVA